MFKDRIKQLYLFVFTVISLQFQELYEDSYMKKNSRRTKKTKKRTIPKGLRKISLIQETTMSQMSVSTTQSLEKPCYSCQIPELIVVPRSHNELNVPAKTFYKEKKLLKEDDQIFKTAENGLSQKPSCELNHQTGLYYCCDYGYYGCYRAVSGMRYDGTTRIAMSEKAMFNQLGQDVYHLRHEYQNCEINSMTGKISCESQLKGNSQKKDYNPRGIQKRMCFNENGTNCKDFNMGCKKIELDLSIDNSSEDTNFEPKYRWVCCNKGVNDMVACEVMDAWKDNL